MDGLVAESNFKAKAGDDELAKGEGVLDIR